MCGICGFYGDKNSELLKGMARVIMHRGPDDEGFYESDKVSLAHRRLSIIDLSPSARQPMHNEDSSIWIVVNGEVYNYKDLRQDLISRGHKFASLSDSEVVVHAYEEWGEDFVSRLSGMFAFVLWDKNKDKLILVRDRLGIKPLYYAQSSRGFLFASEIKSILQDGFLKRQLNRKGFWQYLAFQCIITDETMFEGVYKLEPATILTFQQGKITRRKYWELQKPVKESSEQEVFAALKDAISSHLVSDVPVGVLLSGGLDSSSLVAIMHEQGVNNIETFTVGFGEPDDEFTFAGVVADKFNTKHHEIKIVPQNLKAALSKIVWHMDEPLSDGGAIATYLAAEKIKEFVKVVLVGEGGDEALGGYNWYRLSAFPFNLMPFALRKEIYFYLTTYYRGALREPQEVFLGRFDGKDSFLDSVVNFEINYILPNSLLMKVDKMTMAHALEARVPFLDYKFLQIAYGLKNSKKVSLFTTKKALRRIMSGLLPQDILKRRKHGFMLPVYKLLTGDLKDFTYDIVFGPSNATDSLVGRNAKFKLLKKAYGFKRIENNSMLWKLLIFEIWHRQYLRIAA
ncbi:MAG: asparagine synthase (glutamine-hydrolyzing) [Candidatus Omnitrophota bacterium]